MRDRLRGFRLPAVEVVPLLLMMVVAGGVWAFIALAEEVTEGDTHGFDTALILALRQPGDHAQPIGPFWMPAMARDITSFGSVFAISFIVLVVAGWLVLAKKGRAAVLLLAAAGGGTLLVSLLKASFERPRPDLVAHGAQVFTSSFPSSHALVSTTVYLTLGVIVMRYSDRLALKSYALIVPLVLAVLIGLSRVYLGVHWPTDVLAGWALGAAWACFIWLVALWLQGAGEIETPGSDS